MSPLAIVDRIADAVVALPARAPARVAIDGPRWSGLDLAGGLPDALLARGRTAYVVDLHDFLRPASVRLERGRDDPDAFYEDWVDVAALRREVLEPLDPGGSRRILPTLWDASRDRATRAAYVDVPADGVVVIAGWFLLGAWLPFELTVHVALTASARGRRVPAEDAARELPAWERYDAEVSPVDVADLVVRADDPAHPALIDRLSKTGRS
ncbi:MAG TPA: hypothetical protein VFJ17_01445 [Mycobacteriales bacterium]|jgi:hypothetical protein|nr:hypothetical protein [Mycobacteriales bacterium]